MKKVRAFTLIELCVVMLLSAIVTGIAFFTLSIFQSSVRRFKTDGQAVADLVLLHRLINQDIWKSATVLYTEDGFQTKGKAGLVSYTFLPEVILREMESKTDTFHFKHERLSMLFQKQQIHLRGQYLDEISFELLHKEEVHPFYFYKSYAAEVLMQQDPSAK